MRAECVEEMLRRSQQALLTIRASLRSSADLLEDNSETPETINPRIELLKSILEKELHRIVSLDISFPRAVIPDLYDCVANKSAGFLRSIVFTLAYMDNDGRIDRLPFSKHSLPSLVELEIKQFGARAVKGLFRPTLTRLFLRRMSIPETFGMPEILHHLQDMPLLESLDLCCIASMPDANETRSVDLTVTLHHLRYLKLIDHDLHCAFFLDALALPSLLTLSVMCISIAIASTTSRLDYLVSAIASQVNRINLRQPVLSYSIQHVGCTFQFGGWTRSLSPDVLNTREAPPQNINVAIAFPPSPLRHRHRNFEVAEKMFSSLTLAQTCSLFINDLNLLPQLKSWLLICKKLSGLRELRVHGRSAEILPSILRASLLDSSFSPVLPDLQVLTLEDVVFRQDSASPKQTDYINQLRKALHFRARYTHLQNLVIRRSIGLADDELDRLAQDVISVHSDGFEDLDHSGLLPEEWSDSDDSDNFIYPDSEDSGEELRRDELSDAG